MARRALALIAVVAFAFTATPAHAQTSSRIFVIGIDGTAWPDWTRPALSNIRYLITHGAVGLMSSRTTAPITPDACGESLFPAYATLVRGTRSGPSETSEQALALSTAPGVGRTDLQALEAGDPTGPLTSVWIDDALCRTADISDTMAVADSYVGWLLSRIRPSDRIVVLSLVPPVDRLRDRDVLTPIVVWDASSSPALLESQSTRRAGVVALTDIAPSVLGWVCEPVPRSVTGRPVAAAPRRDALSVVRSLDRRYEHAARVRPYLRVTLVVAMVLAAIALGVVWSGRGRSGGGHAPRGPRGWLAMALTIVASAPLALLGEPAFGFQGVAQSIVFVWLAATVIAIVAVAVGGLRRGIALVCAATSVAMLTDLAAGAPLASTSGLSYIVAEGARFYGIGNEVMGVLIATALVAGAFLLDSGRVPAARIALPAIFAIAIALMISPTIGAKFGSGFVAVPAFGLLAVRASGRRIDRQTVVGLAVATTLVVGLAVAADLLRSPEVRSHVARLASGAGSGHGVLKTKAVSALRMMAGSLWSIAVVVFAATTGALVWRKRGLTDRALWGRPYLRAALIAIAAGAVLAIGSNDAGIEAAALAGMIGASAFFVSFLTTETGD